MRWKQKIETNDQDNYSINITRVNKK